LPFRTAELGHVDARGIRFAGLFAVADKKNEGAIAPSFRLAGAEARDLDREVFTGLKPGASTKNC